MLPDLQPGILQHLEDPWHPAYRGPIDTAKKIDALLVFILRSLDSIEILVKTKSRVERQMIDQEDLYF